MELGLYNHNGTLEPFTVPDDNTLIIGKQKTGKTTLLESLALDAIREEKPFVFVGNIEKIINAIPKKLQTKVLLFNPALQPFPFNIVADVPVKLRPLTVSAITDAIIGLGNFSIEPARIKKYMRYGVSTLVRKNLNLLLLQLLLTDKSFRKRTWLRSPILKRFWERFDTLSLRDQVTFTESTVTRLDSLLLEPLVLNCLFQKRNRLSFKDTIVLVSLNEAELGRENANLLGALVLAHLYTAGIQKVNTTLFVDDAYRYGAPVLNAIISHCPSIHTVYTLQSLSQMKDAPFDQVFAFRTTTKDAKLLQDEFPITNDHQPLSRIPDFTLYATHSERVVKVFPRLPYYPNFHQANKIARRCKVLSQPIETIERSIGGYFSA